MYGPITVSDVKDNWIKSSQVSINSRGDAIVSWQVSDYLEASKYLKSAIKYNGFWSAPTRVTQDHAEIMRYRLSVDEQGRAIAVVQTDNDQNASSYHLLRAEAGVWSPPLDCSVFKNDADVEFALSHDGELIQVKCKMDPMKERWASDCSIVALTRSFENFEAAKMVIADAASVAYRIARIFTNEDGTALVFWQTIDDKLVCVWRKGGAWGKPELICTLPERYYEYKVAVSQQGDATISFADSNGQAYGLFYEDGKWSRPIMISPPGYHMKTPKLAMDAQGSTMFVWDASNQDKDFVVAHHPRGHETVVPLFPQLPSGLSISPTVTCDGFGNFLVTWMVLNIKKIEVYAAVYNTITELWSEPVRLSSEGVHCLHAKQALSASGKGIVSWIALSNPLDRMMQVVEIDTQTNQ